MRSSDQGETQQQLIHKRGAFHHSHVSVYCKCDSSHTSERGSHHAPRATSHTSPAYGGSFAGHPGIPTAPFVIAPTPASSSSLTASRKSSSLATTDVRAARCFFWGEAPTAYRVDARADAGACAATTSKGADVGFGCGPADSTDDGDAESPSRRGSGLEAVAVSHTTAANLAAGAIPAHCSGGDGWLWTVLVAGKAALEEPGVALRAACSATSRLCSDFWRSASDGAANGSCLVTPAGVPRRLHPAESPVGARAASRENGAGWSSLAGLSS